MQEPFETIPYVPIGRNSKMKFELCKRAKSNEHCHYHNCQSIGCCRSIKLSKWSLKIIFVLKMDPTRPLFVYFLFFT